MARENKCIGCPAISRHLRKGELCWDCRHAIDMYPKIKAAQDASQNLKEFGFSVRPAVPNRARDLPCMLALSESIAKFLTSIGNGRIDENAEGRNSHITRYESMWAVCEHQDGFDERLRIMMSEQAYQDYVSMMGQFNTAMEQAFLQGQARGQDLLLQLNDGEITTSRFDERLAAAKSFQRN